MGDRRPNLPLLIGLVASLALHGFALMPMLVQALSGPPGPRIALARFDPEDILRPEPIEPPETVLGLERGSPSTLTWIGHEEYEKHLATLAEVEQAAFEDEPTGDEGQSPPSLLMDPEQVAGAVAGASDADGRSDAPPVTTVDDPVAAATTVEPDVETGRDAPGALLNLEARQELAEVLAAIIRPFGVSLLAPAAQRAEQAVDPAQRRDPSEGRDAPASNRTPSERDASTAGTAAASPRPQDQPPGTPNLGERSDKESDPTSLVEVPMNEIQVGKTLAAMGLELHPRRPRFTTLQRLTAAAGNPIVEISFGPDGVPRKVIMHRGTGNSGIDAAIEASLYRWRATGEPLKDLNEGETVDVGLRIILFGR